VSVCANCMETAAPGVRIAVAMTTDAFIAASNAVNE
jgi:hypothetical protein